MADKSHVENQVRWWIGTQCTLQLLLTLSFFVTWSWRRKGEHCRKSPENGEWQCLRRERCVSSSFSSSDPCHPFSFMIRELYSFFSFWLKKVEDTQKSSHPPGYNIYIIHLQEMTTFCDEGTECLSSGKDDRILSEEANGNWTCNPSMSSAHHQKKVEWISRNESPQFPFDLWDRNKNVFFVAIQLESWSSSLHLFLLVLATNHIWASGCVLTQLIYTTRGEMQGDKQWDETFIRR